MFVAEDVHSQAEIEEAVGDTEVKEPELALARQVIDSLVGEFDPDELTSDYRRDLRAMLEAKLAGEEISVPEPVPTRRPWSTSWRRCAEASPRSRTRRTAPAKKKAAAKPRGPEEGRGALGTEQTS